MKFPCLSFHHSCLYKVKVLTMIYFANLTFMVECNLEFKMPFSHAIAIFMSNFLTDPPIIWDYGYYITINPKTWSHTLPKIKLPQNDPKNVMQGKHINLFSYKTNVITLISGIKHQIWLCQMCLTVFLQKDRKESVSKDSVSAYRQGLRLVGLHCLVFLQLLYVLVITQGRRVFLWKLLGQLA